LDFGEGIDNDSSEFNSNKSTRSMPKEASFDHPLSIPDAELDRSSTKPKERTVDILKETHSKTLTERLKRLRAPICSLQRLPEIIAAKEAADANICGNRKVSSIAKKKRRKRQKKMKISMGNRRK
jgi:hypothetical protein